MHLAPRALSSMVPVTGKRESHQNSNNGGSRQQFEQCESPTIIHERGTHFEDFFGGCRYILLKIKNYQ